ncbi:lysylphosphatidylglycerol synthase transmembrane domain-containing protein [Pseudonocardia sp.]|uniref:lysylphosphatidylglycerol synthase transmembrane domain-containing protein n=1 Tax=Pseudonocardia sp. TaxID=60912 RepID=UPI00260184D9|nr:lysylphosphatidylglycerol synthase transmembrane domain-containing protein [Pseudonocardia sp.]MCW2722606.1 hypothetical protein [Pseudonocardia sp.]MDT7615587.1 glycosyltransferase 2 family protein [Pseudonocardiales bacterium]
MRRWRTAVRVLVVAAFAGAVVWVLASRWQEVQPLLGRLSAGSVLGALAAVLAGIFGTFLCWRALLADLGSPLPVPGAMRVFFVGQLGKYLPGSLWPVLAQMELGRDYKVPPRASGAAVAVFLVVIVGTGLVIAVPSLPLLADGAVATYWWTLIALPVAIVVAAPPVLNRLIGTALRLARRPALPQPLTLGGIARAAGWALLSWIAYGVHVWVLALQLGATPTPWLLLVATGAFAAAWAIGFLVVVAPAGAGVRDAALILLLAGVLSAPQATVIAVLSRLMFTVGDVAWCLPALVARRMSTRQGSADETGAEISAVSPTPSSRGTGSSPAARRRPWRRT